MKTFTNQNIKNIEKAVINSGVTTTDKLMQKAGYGVFMEIYKYIATLDPFFKKRIVFLIGKGKNGGDGLIAASFTARQTHIPVIACLVEEPKEDSINKQLVAELPTTIEIRYPGDDLPYELLSPGTIIIDGLLGIGLDGYVKAPYSNWIFQIANSNLPIISIDIPSGLNGDTGIPDHYTVKATKTICLGLWKKGIFTEQGRAYCGTLSFVDLDFTEEFLFDLESDIEIFDISDARRLIPTRDPLNHKYNFGKVVVVGGSTAYPGAPILTAESAIRAGCGLVTAVIPYGVRCVLPPRSSAIIVQEVAGEFGYFNKQASFDIEHTLAKAQSIVFGPGVGKKPQTTDAISNIMATNHRGVIDADGLWHLMVNKQFCGSEYILTPHAGEAYELLINADLEDVTKASRATQAQALAQFYGCVVVLKGLGTIVADEHRYVVISSGNDALASGGTGDSLSGIIASFQAQGLAAFDAAALGCWVHGRVAEIYPHGTRALVADDIPQYLGQVFKEITPFA